MLSFTGNASPFKSSSPKVENTADAEGLEQGYLDVVGEVHYDMSSYYVMYSRTSRYCISSLCETPKFHGFKDFKHFMATIS